MTPDALSVSAAIRLSPVDSIGVPVFMSSNSMYLPEMDADFNISAFMHFENEEGYELTSLIPDHYRQQMFRIGDPGRRGRFWRETGAEVAATLTTLALKQYPGLESFSQKI